MNYLKLVPFTCDFCGKEERGGFERRASDNGYNLFLPRGWEGEVNLGHYCSELCEARFQLKTLENKIKALEAEEGE